MSRSPTVISVCSKGPNVVPHEWVDLPTEDDPAGDPIKRFVDILRIDGQRVTLERCEVVPGSYSMLGNCACDLHLRTEHGKAMSLQVFVEDRGVSDQRVEQILKANAV
jgi:hypothetical protein